MSTTRRGIAICAVAVSAWLVASAPASAASYYVSSTKKITASTPAAYTSSPCASTKPCLSSTGSFASNKTSVSGYIVVTYYKSTTSSNTSGTLLGTVTSPIFSVPSGSTATYSKTVPYTCKSWSTTTTTYYYWSVAKFMNSSGSVSSDASTKSGVLKLAKSCAT